MIAVTPRQLIYLLTKVQYGLSDKQVARMHGVHEQTVKNHFHRLRQRLGVHTTPHAIYVLWPVIEPMLEAVAKTQHKMPSTAGTLDSLSRSHLG